MHNGAGHRGVEDHTCIDRGYCGEGIEEGVCKGVRKCMVRLWRL